MQRYIFFYKHSDWQIRGKTPKFNNRCTPKQLTKVDGFRYLILFQSAHPRGVRLSAIFRPIVVSGFNPRTHVGCDPTAPQPHSSASCFNPRTHVGCDILSRRCWRCMTSFNPRTHVGCDNNFDSEWQDAFVSIHAPTWGATK